MQGEPIALALGACFQPRPSPEQRRIITGIRSFVAEDLSSQSETPAIADDGRTISTSIPTLMPRATASTASGPELDALN